MAAQAPPGETVDAVPVADVPGPPARPLATPPVPGHPAGLCYGEAIREAGRTFIPVARVSTDGSRMKAVPVGVLDIGPRGARFRSIPAAPGPDGVGRAAAVALAAVAGAAGAAALMRRRPARTPWPPRSRRR